MSERKIIYIDVACTDEEIQNNIEKIKNIFGDKVTIGQPRTFSQSHGFIDQYIKDAVRTESRLNELNLNLELISNLFKIFIEISEILDGVKKGVFYNKDTKYKDELAIRLENIEILLWDCYPHHGWGLEGDGDNLNLKGETVNNIDPRVFHGILGVMTEAGELAEIVVDLLDNPDKQLDKVHLQEELGDSAALGWYGAILHDATGLSAEETLNKNIAKLKKRYPEKFTNDHANNRDLKAEREVLEK